MFHSVLSATPQSHSPIWYICQNTVIPDLLLDIPINPVWECSMHQRTEPKLLAPHQIYARWCLDFWCRTQCRRFAAPWGALWPHLPEMLELCWRGWAQGRLMLLGKRPGHPEMTLWVCGAVGISGIFHKHSITARIKSSKCYLIISVRWKWNPSWVLENA